MGPGTGAAGMLLTGSEFSSFGLCGTRLGDLGAGSSLRVSGTSQAGLVKGQIPGLAVKSGRQNRPFLKDKRREGTKSVLVRVNCRPEQHKHNTFSRKYKQHPHTFAHSVI